MNRTISFLLAFLCALIFVPELSGQIYVIDDNFKDSVDVYAIEYSKDKTAEVPGACAFKIPLGDTVVVERTLKGNPGYPAVRFNGKEYTISHGYLLFSESNPEGTVDVFGDTRGRRNHSAMGKFFATMLPYWVVAILFATAMAFTFLGLRFDKARMPAIIAVPVCILLASLIEIWAVYIMGDSAFWWCDKDTYGFWGSFVRVIPFVAFVSFQIYSIKFYKRLLQEEYLCDDVSLKPMAISIASCVPVTIAVALVCSLAKMGETLADSLTVASFVLSLGIGLWMSAKRNVAALGKSGGLLFTLFAAIYIVGSIVAVYGLIIALLRLLIQVLMVCAGVFLIMMMGSTRRVRDSYGNVYEEDGFGNRTRIY